MAEFDDDSSRDNQSCGEAGCSRQCHLQPLLYNGDGDGQDLIAKYGGEDVQACSTALPQVPSADLLSTILLIFFSMPSPPAANPNSCERCASTLQQADTTLLVFQSSMTTATACPSRTLARGSPPRLPPPHSLCNLSRLIASQSCSFAGRLSNILLGAHVLCIALMAQSLNVPLAAAVTFWLA